MSDQRMGMEQKVGFIGLGRIGLPVALRLAGAGCDLVGFDQAPRDEVRRLAEAGGQLTDDLAATVRDRDIVISLLPDSASVEAVLGSDAVRTHLAPGMTWVDMSSGFPADTRRFASLLKEQHGVELVDAPICNGGVGGAYEGSLTLCIGGDPGAVQRVIPVLQVAATTIIPVGEVGSGHTVKLLVNFVPLGVGALMSELYAIAQASGLDVSSVAEWMEDCVAARFVKLDHINSVLFADPREGDAQFRAALARKDLRYLAAHAAAVGAFSPIAEGAHLQYLIAEQLGLGSAESIAGPWTALRRLLEAEGRPGSRDERT